MNLNKILSLKISCLFFFTILSILIVGCNQGQSINPLNINTDSTNTNLTSHAFTTTYTHEVFTNIILYSNFMTTAKIITIHYEAVNFVGVSSSTNLLIRINERDHMSLISNFNRLIFTNTTSDLMIVSNDLMSNVFVSRTNYITNRQLSNIFIAISNDGDAVGATINFEDTDDLSSVVLLTNANLSNLDFGNYNMSNANLSGADLLGANFTNAKTNGAILTGVRNADFSGAIP